MYILYILLILDIKNENIKIYKKWNDDEKKKFIFIYKYNESYIDNEEAVAIWLFLGSLAYIIMNNHYKIFMVYGIIVIFIVQYWKH